MAVVTRSSTTLTGITSQTFVQLVLPKRSSSEKNDKQIPEKNPVLVTIVTVVTPFAGTLPKHLSSDMTNKKRRLDDSNRLV